MLFFYGGSSLWNTLINSVLALNIISIVFFWSSKDWYCFCNFFQNLFETRLNVSVHSKHNRNASLSSPYMAYRSCLSQYSTMIPNLPGKFNKSGATSVDMVSEDASALATPRIKFKRLDKTAKHIMQVYKMVSFCQI